MRRIGTKARRIIAPVRHRLRVAWTLGLLATVGSRANAQGLELSAPVGVLPDAPASQPIVSKPASRGPVLALPGITTPPNHAPAPVAVDPLMPSLDAPVGMSNAPPASRATEPPMMDALPFEPSAPLLDKPNAAPARSTVRRPASSAPVTNLPKTTVTPPPAASRRPWFFGAPRPGTTPTPSTSSARNLDTTRDRLPEPKVDPAEQAALKRKIERQARALVGDRARALEVRVAGKQVVIEARGVRMLQKRAVRKSLETMPSLSGLRSSVVVLD